jgi:tripartite-type tricarboxylate transporter receptor subunit TctC
MNRRQILASLAMLAVLAPSAALAQYPAKPIRMIVPFPAGGPTDSVARTVAQAMSKSLGQAMVVENKPGADGAIAAQVAAGAAPDGYTLFFSTSSVMALPIVNKSAPFDPFADFTPISTVGRFAFGMFATPSVPSGSLKEFVDYARAHPGKLNFGAANVAEHMAAEQFMKATSTDLVRIPYKGAAQALPDLIAGRIQVYFTPVGGAIGLAKEGKLRMVATMLPERLPLAPDVPTLKEAGVNGVAVHSWQVLLAPAKTPRDIVDRLSREVNAALKDPEVRAQLENRALFVEGSTPQGLAAVLQESHRDWIAFARDTGVAQ